MADETKKASVNTEQSAKKKRLSSALRDNLKRRKAAPRPKKPADHPTAK